MRKILQFDDDLFISEIFGITFKKNGFDYKWYSEPPEKSEDLIKLVLEEKPDMIISDITHPKMDGFEMLRTLKDNKSTINFLFVFFTNHDSKEEKEKAQEMGALAYFITAEYTPDKFVIEIKNLLEKIEKSNPVKGYKRGVFVLLRAFPNQPKIEDFLSFTPESNTEKAFILEPSLTIFNEILFANWYLVNFIDELKQHPKENISANDTFFISEVLNQERWDYIIETVTKGGGISAVLNPCIAKDHKCPTYRFFLNEEKYFMKLKNWFSKCPNKHYTVKGHEKNGLLLLEKPFIDEKGEIKLGE